MSKVVSLRGYKAMKEQDDHDLAYRAKILSMSKVELLEEMVYFQERRRDAGHLTLQMMLEGRHLFKALEEAADTEELRILSRSYRNHLEYEIAAIRQKA